MPTVFDYDSFMRQRLAGSIGKPRQSGHKRPAPAIPPAASNTTINTGGAGGVAGGGGGTIYGAGGGGGGGSAASGCLGGGGGGAGGAGIGAGNGGNGGAAANLNVEPTVLTFGEQAVGTRSQPKSITVRNPDHKQFPAVPVLTIAADPSFQIDRSDCELGLKPNGKCELHVVFAPEMVGEARQLVLVCSTPVGMSGVGK